MKVSKAALPVADEVRTVLASVKKSVVALLEAQYVKKRMGKKKEGGDLPGLIGSGVSCLLRRHRCGRVSSIGNGIGNGIGNLLPYPLIFIATEALKHSQVALDGTLSLHRGWTPFCSPI